MITSVPKLEVDAGRILSTEARIERLIIAALIEHLERAGWSVHHMFDGDDVTRVRNARGAMELIFDLDEAWLYFEKTGAQQGVFLVVGSGEDIITDWNYRRGDVNGFNAVMEAFDPARVIANNLTGG